jgi:hypothetical protein
MNSYQMVLHRPVETAPDFGKFVTKLTLTRLGFFGLALNGWSGATLDLRSHFDRMSSAWFAMPSGFAVPLENTITPIPLARFISSADV